MVGRSLLVCSALLLNLSAWPAPAPQANPAAAIDQRIQAAIQGFPGSVSLYARNLDTGVSYGLRADAPVPTASTIKLPIMVELFAEAGGGKARLEPEDPADQSGQSLGQRSAHRVFSRRRLTYTRPYARDDRRQ